MKKINHTALLIVPAAAAFLLQGCYTQLAVSHHVIERHYVSPGVEASADTVAEESAPPDTVIQEHYWSRGYYYDPWNWYDPFYDPGFHFSFRYAWGDPYWHPWCYRPYDPYWTWWGPAYWYDPYYAWYDPWYYSGYRYGYPYRNWYWARYDFVDPVPRNKRDWDRRRGESQGSQPVAAPGPMVRVGTDTQAKPRSVERVRDRAPKETPKGRRPSKRATGREETRRRSGREGKSDFSFTRTVVRVLDRVSKGSSSGNSGSVSRRSTSSGSSGHSVKSAPRRSSGSVSRSRPSRSSSGGGKSSSSGKRSPGGKSNR